MMFSPVEIFIKIAKIVFTQLSVYSICIQWQKTPA